MNYEKSCGAIVYRKFHGNTEILLIRHLRSGCWSFPKGHMEEGESETQTAVRETKEETNIDISIDDPTFRECVEYSPRRGTMKSVVYFIGRATSFDAAAQEDEIAELRWTEIGRAAAMMVYDNDRQIVNRVKNYLSAGRI